MGRINKANWKKTIYYLKRNGIKNTWYAARERMKEGSQAAYIYAPISEEEKAAQQKWSVGKERCFSIVVPTYRTKEIFLREMLQSVLEQTYPNWELILADATEDDSVKKVIDQICKEGIASEIVEKIKYRKLTENAGIAENTNRALEEAEGDYIALLDHDDVLTPDALYEMAMHIEEGKKQGKELQMLYSDEDKCNGERTRYYEPHYKENFNLDLLLSNNYICHLLVMKSELMKELGFRSQFEGAQDYDLVLRAAGKLAEQPETICHISKVLYHWRCHTGSTAENPQSKQYAYDAGLAALQDFADRKGYGARAVALKHLGFYTLEYPSEIWQVRPELGAVGGRILGKKNFWSPAQVIGGRMRLADQSVVYEALLAQYSGYMHRGVLTQQAEAVDIRCIQVRKECHALFEQTVGVPYVEKNQLFDVSVLPEDTDYKELSIKLCRALKNAGYVILYQPGLERVWKGHK